MLTPVWVAPAPIPAPYRPVYKRAWFIVLAVLVVIFGGLLAIVVLIGGAAVVAVSKLPSTFPSSFPSVSSSAAPATAAIGQAVRDGKFEFIVKSVKCGVPSVGASVVAEKAQGQFCLVTLSVRNISTDPQTMDDSAQVLHDGSGANYQADSTAGLVANPGSDSVFFQNINPGNSVSGVIVFDVPKTVTPTSIELHDSLFSGGVTVGL